MNRRAPPALILSGLVLVLGGPPSREARADPASGPGAQVSATVIRGAGTYPTAAAPVAPRLRSGDITLNFPAADVRDLAKAVLGEMLGLSYIVEPGVSGAVTLVTAQPIARSAVLVAFENALRASNLALIRRGGAYVVAPVAEARGAAPIVALGDAGFGSETIQLRYIAAAELKRLLDPVVPDAVTITDPTRNIVSVTGTTGQRQSVHDLITQFDTDWLQGTSFGLYVPKHTDARIIVPEINRLLNGDGAPSAGLVRLIAMDKINGILAVAAQPQYLDDVQRWIEVLDREGESNEPRLFVYRVQNGRSADLAAVLNGAFGADSGHKSALSSADTSPSIGDSLDVQPGARPVPPPNANPAPMGGEAGFGGQSAMPINATITSDETNNAVLVYATPRDYAVIEDALRQLDITPLQVLIDAVITEVDLNHNLQYGVQWSFTAGRNTFGLAPLTSATSSSSSGGSSTGATSTAQPGFTWSYFNGGSIQATLNALSSLTKVNVLSAPQLLVLNNHTASLEVGDEVPIVTASSVSTIGTNAPQVNSVDYKDTGVILKVTPRVNAGGLVLLDIAQEVSDVSATTSSSINPPTIQQRKFSSSIAVQDGQTVVLGGLIRDNSIRGRNGIPILNVIPILGALAGQKLNSDARTELIILLTPRVVRTQADASAVTDDLKRKIQSIEPIRPVDAFRP